MAPRSVTNAFGDGSPSWNMPFPVGNLTAAEIIAYFPHWLKSIDVVDRFVANGGGSTVIVDMINKYRMIPQPQLPMNSRHPQPLLLMKRNSICIMMQNAMRNSGMKNWTVGTHFDFVQTTLGEWDTGDVSVTRFRPPRETHPKSGNATIFNREASPIEFRDLSQHVKERPSGPDALDLTRCVAYACSHPEQSWLFPTQFQELVEKLGGARAVTLDNSDTEVFARHSPLVPIVPLCFRTQRLRARPVLSTAARSINKKSGGRDNHSQKPQPQPQSLTRSRKPHVSLEINHREVLPKTNRVTSPFNMRLTRSQRTVAGNPAPLPQRSPPHTLSGAFSNMGGIRKSTRLAKKLSRALHKSPDLSEGTQADSPTAETNDGDWTINNKRKRGEEETYEPAARGLVSTSSDNSSMVEDGSAGTPTPRPSAKKARLNIQNILTKADPPISRKVVQPAMPIDPALTAAAQGFAKCIPIYVKPPVLNPNRLVVDRHSIWLYAEEGAPDLWASALSSTRFGGPRRSAPFRELYRLTQPDVRDASDWAENIRWAKEQFKLFGSATWTEYDYHLEMITEHRRTSHWVSEEAIQFGSA